jgi:hypothetical protein
VRTGFFPQRRKLNGKGVSIFLSNLSKIVKETAYLEIGFKAKYPMPLAVLVRWLDMEEVNGCRESLTED